MQSPPWIGPCPSASRPLRQRPVTRCLVLATLDAPMTPRLDRKRGKCVLPTPLAPKLVLETFPWSAPVGTEPSDAWSWLCTS